MIRKRFVLTDDICQRIELEDPGLKGRDLTAYLEREISLEYPGRIGNLSWDFRKKNGRIHVYYMDREAFSQLGVTQGKSVAFQFEGEETRIFRNREKDIKAVRSAGGVALFIMLTLIFFVFPLLRNRELKRELQEITIRAGEERVRYAEELDKNSRLEDVRRKLNILENAEPPDLYERLSLFHPYFTGGDYIGSITIQDGEFQCHAFSRDPLKLLDKIREDDTFGRVVIESTEVDPDSSLESFMWKGGFRE